MSSSDRRARAGRGGAGRGGPGRWRRLERLTPAIAAALAYLPNVDDYYVSDDFDHPYLTGYSFSRFAAHVLEPSSAGEFFRPVGQLSMALDHLLFGRQPEPSHVVSILLHAGCAMLVGHLGEALLRREDGAVARRVGTLSGLLFALHPIHPEAVSFLGSRFDLTAAFFGLASLAAYIRAAESREPEHDTRVSLQARWLTASALLLLLAMGSKESALLLPFAVLGYEAWLASERRWWRVIPSFAVLAAVVGWRVGVVGDLGGYVTAGETRHLPAFDGAFFVELVSFPAYGLFTPVNHAALGAAAGPAVWLLAAVASLPVPFVARRRLYLRPLMWSLGFSVLCLLPPSSLFSTGGLAERLEGARFLYLASAGASLAMALAVEQVSPRGLRSFVSGGQLTLFLVLLLAHVRVWSETAALARGTVETVLSECPDPVGPAPTVLVAGPPDNHRGAFLWRNGLGAAIRQLHPRAPDARFSRADLEPDFFEPEGFDVREFAGRQDACLFRWDADRGRVESRTDALRAAASPPRPAPVEGWAGWTAYNASEVSRAPGWSLRADGEDPHVVSPAAPIGVREIDFVMRVSAPDAPPDAFGEIFWAAGHEAFAVELHHRTITVTPDGESHRYRFPLPLTDPEELEADSLHVRIDPTLFPADITIESLTLR